MKLLPEKLIIFNNASIADQIITSCWLLPALTSSAAIMERSMTLVVARCVNGRIAIAADTLVSEHDVVLPATNGVLKSYCLPGYLCASFSGSPELAAKEFLGFEQKHPDGTNFDGAVKYFERASFDTGNDFILAFGQHPKLVTIRDGQRIQTLSRTHWIGDKSGYECFRMHERRQRKRYEQGRAVNAALFADEMTGSPSSDLHGTMRNVISDDTVPSVGGFVTVLANRDIGFRYSVDSDVLLDWPGGWPETEDLQLTDKIDLVASGENDRYSINQISPGYYNMNAVAFYVLKGQLLVYLQGGRGGLVGQCKVFSGDKPQDIANTLDEELGFPFRALCMVMSSRSEYPIEGRNRSADEGVGLSLFCEVNTMPEPVPKAS